VFPRHWNNLTSDYILTLSSSIFPSTAFNVHFSSKIRLGFMKRNSVRHLGLERLEARELFSVTNFSMYQSVIADSFINGNSPHEAVDGMVSNDSRWASDASGNSWLEVTLSAPYSVGSAHLYLGCILASPVVTQHVRDTNTNPADRQEWQPSKCKSMRTRENVTATWN
jgi:hypothetical protein